MEGSNRQRAPLQRLLRIIEWLGNFLPHPVILFLMFCAVTVFVSWLFHGLGVRVLDPRPIGASGRSADGWIYTVNLFSPEFMRQYLPNVVKNFTGFAPLGTVLVTMLGVGIAEYSGLLTTAIRAIVLGTPRSLVTYALVFAGVLSNVASEMGYVVLIPLGGYIFFSIGRHPLAGLAAAFAGVSGGYSANLLIGTIDPLLSGITQEAARLLASDYVVHPAVNWYFMAASTFLITIVGGLVSEKIVEPALGPYEPEAARDKSLAQEQSRLLAPLSAIERRGLIAALFSLIIFFAMVAITAIGPHGMLRDPAGDELLKSPLMKSLIPIITVAFIVPSLVYGWITASIRSTKGLVAGMEQSMSRLGLYIVIVFFASQFIALFHDSNLGLVLAVTGADFLKQLQLTGPLVFFPFIFLCALINLMIGSASAQWAVTAPIFVPMMMLVGYAPEAVQAAYRIGDSVTNLITPMMSYFGLILAFADRFRKDIGVGTIISTMLPYTVVFFIAWSLFFYIWVFALGLPVGPGAATYYP
jgi:aminobenzoyl-glutamate transport protein